MPKQSKNAVLCIAHAAGRDYITPQDVTAAFRLHSKTKVRLDVLEVLGGLAGAEDRGLCAFVAWRGKKS